MSGSELVTENRKPRVSVIVPVYNTAKYVEQAVISLMNQTLKEIEIILVNDGSTDNSLEVITKLADMDSRITIVSQENGGPSKGRNNGISIASGCYLYFMDSDDYIAEDTLEACYSRCEELNLDFVFFDAGQFCENSTLKPGVSYDRKGQIEDRVYDGPQILEVLLNKNIYRVSPCLIFIRREFYDSAGLSFYEGIIHEDELFTPRLYLNASRVGRIDKPFYKRRFREDSIMSSAFAMKNINAYFTVSKELVKLGRTMDRRRRNLVDRLLKDMLNAAVYKAHILPPAEKIKVMWIAVTRFAVYIQPKTILVLIFKR